MPSVANLYGPDQIASVEEIRVLECKNGVSDDQRVPAPFVMEYVPDLLQRIKEAMSKCPDPSRRYVPCLTLA